MMICNKEIYSYDLKSATDRLPIHIQVAALRQLLGGSVAKTWLDLMTYLSFYNKDTKVGLAGRLKYAVGQGIGLYSS